MITSIPLEAYLLGLNIQDYKNIARNVNRILLIAEDKLQKILEKAQKELPLKINTIARSLIESMAYDKEFYQAAKIDDSKGPPIPGCFTIALVDYLLRNKHKIKIPNSTQKHKTF